LRIAVDIGGTFTDLVSVADDGVLHYTKSLTTYEEGLSRGIADCLNDADVAVRDAALVLHGSTIAINTVIQRTGARTGLITTRGFRDVYEIGRSNRPDAYNLLFERPVPLVPRDLRLEVDERLDARGNVITPLDENGVHAAAAALRAAEVEAVAVVLLHAYANPAHEVRVGEILRELLPDAQVSLSHEILREFREYERTSTTVLNAYVAPVVSRYLEEIESLLSEEGFGGSFLIMQSNGGAMSARVARGRPVSTMESGPVAGVIGAGRLGPRLGLPDVIAFDMGGTTAKASLVRDGEPRVVTGYHIGGETSGHPMMLPVVDIVEVGAGGGSIAWIDAAGALKVGPHSAGASPGPVCYGRGGTEPTVTDANLVLGRLRADRFLGGSMTLDLDAAETAVRERIAEPLGMGVHEAALGIVEVVDTKMSLAVREVSVTKGHDTRDFAMVAYGGAGPLHASAIARTLAVPRVVVPEFPGTFSAFGMLLADLRHDYVQTFIGPLAAVDPDRVNREYDRLAQAGLETLERDGIRHEEVGYVRSMDLRYQGQEYTLMVGVPNGLLDEADLTAVAEAFHSLHEARYGQSAPEQPVEVVNLRLAAAAAMRGGEVVIAKHPGLGGPAPEAKEDVWFDTGGPTRCRIVDRAALASGDVVDGPALIQEYVSTTVLRPGDRATVSPLGPLVVEIGREE